MFSMFSLLKCAKVFLCFSDFNFDNLKKSFFIEKLLNGKEAIIAALDSFKSSKNYLYSLKKVFCLKLYFRFW